MKLTTTTPIIKQTTTKTIDANEDQFPRCGFVKNEIDNNNNSDEPLTEIDTKNTIIENNEIYKQMKELETNNFLNVRS